MIKKCFIDLETTGLYPKKHGILEIGGTIECGDTEPYRCEDFHFQCQPHEGDLIEQTALDKNKITREEIKTFPSMMDTYRRLVELLLWHVDKYNRKDKLFFIAYNANFDSQFLREFFKKAGDQYYGSYFWHPPIDVMGLAAKHLMKDRASMPDFHLSTVAKHMGLSVHEEETHGAMYDIRLTTELYYRLEKEGL